jgi:hypothetical protein
MKSMCIFLSILIFFALYGCNERTYTRAPHYRWGTAPVAPQVKVISIDVIEGKTKKSEILSILGAPDSTQSSEYASYNVYDDNKIIKIRLVQKDGTEILYGLAKGENQTHVSFHFKRGIVDTAHVF